jgi:hypothetical protein
MKSFRAQIRSSTLALIIAVLVVFNGLVYWGLTSLLQRFVDGRLLGLAETLTNVIEQKPELLSTLKNEIVLQKSERPGDERSDELSEVSPFSPGVSSRRSRIVEGIGRVTRPSAFHRCAQPR